MCQTVRLDRKHCNVPPRPPLNQSYSHPGPRKGSAATAVRPPLVPDEALPRWVISYVTDKPLCREMGPNEPILSSLFLLLGGKEKKLISKGNKNTIMLEGYFGCCLRHDRSALIVEAPTPSKYCCERQVKYDITQASCSLCVISSVDRISEMRCSLWLLTIGNIRRSNVALIVLLAYLTSTVGM